MKFPALPLCWALVALMVGFLIGPRVPDALQKDQCVINVRFAGPFGTSFNCDSPDFMQLAQHPSLLLEPGSRRQSRPGLIFAAGAIAAPFAPLTNSLGQVLSHNLVYYAAFIAINVAILLLSFFLFLKMAWPNWRSDGWTVTTLISICFLLAANDVVKAFIWSPHTQMFNIFVPLFALWAWKRTSEGALLDIGFVMLVGLITGLGMTAYGFFIVAIPCVFIPATIFCFTKWSARTARNFLLFVALSVAPALLWYVFVRYETGGFHQQEMAEGYLVWIIAAWHQGNLIPRWTSNFKGLLGFAEGEGIALAPIMAVICALAILNWAKVSKALRSQLPLVLSAVVVSLIAIVFYSTIGLIVWRLAYPMIPPIICIAGCLAGALDKTIPESGRKILACTCAAVVIVQCIYVIVKDGPFA